MKRTAVNIITIKNKNKTALYMPLASLNVFLIENHIHFTTFKRYIQSGNKWIF